MFFALSFLVVIAATHFILRHYPVHGLRWMAFFAGFTDIDPYILTLVGGKLSSTQADLSQAILIATASNNLLKAGYVTLLGAGYTRWLASVVLVILAGLTLGYGYLILN